MTNLSIVTVSFNSEKFIGKYLLSVLKYAPKGSELIIVDSGSKDKTVKIIKDYIKRPARDLPIKLIESRENIGFSKGNNLAVKRSKGRFIFFLNPDTELVNPLDYIVSFYQQSKKIGLVAPKLTMSDGKIQPSVKKLPSIWGAFKEYVLNMGCSYSEYIPNTSEPVEVEAVYGAAMLVSREVFNRVKGFNENFFLYYEDMDFCRKIKKIDKKIFYYPGVEIMHLVGAARGDEDRYLLNKKSAAIYHGKIGAFFLQLIFLVPRLRRRLSVR